MVSNQEVTLKRLRSLLRISQKLYVGAYSDLCEMNCSYNNVAKGIRLLDKKSIFVYTGKISCSYTPLKMQQMVNQFNLSLLFTSILCACEQAMLCCIRSPRLSLLASVGAASANSEKFRGIRPGSTLISCVIT